MVNNFIRLRAVRRNCLHDTGMKSYRYELEISYRVYMKMRVEFIPLSYLGRAMNKDKAHALLVPSSPALVVSFRNETRTDFTW